MTKKVKDVIKMLEAEGWKHGRTTGDHRIFVKEGKRSISVAGKESSDVPIGTLKSILRAMKQ